jgi:hypothetical protein
VVWFAIDPPLWSPSGRLGANVPIGASSPHFYKAHCNVVSASTGIQAIGGSMTDEFSRTEPAYWSRSLTANAAGIAAPGSLDHSSHPGTGDYDVKVTGGPAGGTYLIYGGWVQGSGCG